MKRGYEFCSETDTEVLVKLLDHNYHGEPLDAILRTLEQVRGSYGLAILFKDFPGQIFSVRKESPLIVGYGAGENFLASDIPALLRYTRDYAVLEEGEIAVLSADKIDVYDAFGHPVQKQHLTADWDIGAAEKAIILTLCSRRSTSSRRPCAPPSIRAYRTACPRWACPD